LFQKIVFSLYPSIFRQQQQSNDLSPFLPPVASDGFPDPGLA
jgi:hypothetical protein